MEFVMEKNGIDAWNSDSKIMTISAEVLLKKTKKFEVQGLETNKIALASVSNLEQLLDEVYVGRSPKQLDYDRRRDLVRIFNVIAKEVYGDCKEPPCVVEFGSFVMDMFSAESDLDLSINFRNNVVEIPKLKKVLFLRKLVKKLNNLQRGGHVSGIQAIMTARVPIVKVIDRGTRVECDVSVENRDGIAKSLIIRAISTIDERFRKLSFLMKAWAKANNINSSKDRTLNSLSLVSLVAFHLQTRDPPILPPFSALFKDGKDPASVMKVVPNYLRYGERNTESLAKLFVTLLVKLASVEKLWKERLCASLCEGSWIFKAWNYRAGEMSVEDFTYQSENIARAVRKEGFEMINGCIRRSLQYIEAFSDGQMQRSMLKVLLFGRDRMCSIEDSVTINLDESKTILSSNDSNQMEKMQSAADLGSENQSQTQLVVHHETHLTEKRQITDLQKSNDESHQTKNGQLTGPQKSQDETYQIMETQLRTDLQKSKEETHQTKQAQLTCLQKPKDETHQTKKRQITDLQKSNNESHQTKKGQLTGPQKLQDETYRIKETQLRTDLQKSKEETHQTKQAQLTCPQKPKDETNQTKKRRITDLQKSNDEKHQTKKRQLTGLQKPQDEAYQIKETQLRTDLQKSKEETHQTKQTHLACLQKPKDETHQTKKRRITDLQKSNDETHQTKKRQLTGPIKSQDEIYQIKETQLRTDLQKSKDKTHQTKQTQCLQKPKDGTHLTKKPQFTDAKRGKRVQLLYRRGGVQFKGRSKKQLVDNSVKPVSLSSSGWEQNHSQREWKHFVENRVHRTTQFAPRAPQHVPFPHSSSFHHPVAVPSVYSPYSTGFQRLYNPIPVASLVHLLNPLGHSLQAPMPMPHGGSLEARSLQAPAPMPNFETIRGQHVQRQAYTTPWRPR